MQKNRFKAFFLATILTGAVGGLIGCATPATKEAMTADKVVVAKKHPRTVSITAQGGSETGVMDSSNISNSDFAKAIETSIVKNGLFTQVLEGGSGDYLLNVAITSISKPMFGASFTVNMEAGWTLMEKSTGKIVMRESIRSSSTVTMGQALIGVERLRLAVEGAARENIRDGLAAISKLKLD